MSAYKGHRGPNVSQYIANLNTLSPPQQDLLSEPPTVPEDFSAFLNTDFFDVNGGNNVDLQSPIDFNVDFDAQQAGQPSVAKKLRTSTSSASAESSIDFSLTGDFQFTDFNNFGAAPILDPSSMQALPQPQSNPYSLPPNFSSTSALSPDFDQFSAKKRKHDDLVPSTSLALDDSARGAAEEDKRRRNTAASARFRVKKKQREQALEKSAKEMADRVTAMEARIQQLETENTWLKGLITEKNGGKSSTSELRALISKREETASGRSNSNRTDGVGTDEARLKADA